MSRSPVSRLNATLAALVFAGTGGVTGSEAHPLSMRGPHADEVLALELGGRAHDAGLHGIPHHNGHPGHQQGSDCTCLGPCPGGATPPMRDAPTPTERIGFSTTVRETPASAATVQSDPRSYLHPLPNGPPERA